jgi:hypothetical protein
VVGGFAVASGSTGFHNPGRALTMTVKPRMQTSYGDCNSNKLVKILMGEWTSCGALEILGFRCGWVFIGSGPVEPALPARLQGVQAELCFQGPQLCNGRSGGAYPIRNFPALVQIVAQDDWRLATFANGTGYQRCSAEHSRSKCSAIAPEQESSTACQ